MSRFQDFLQKFGLEKITKETSWVGDGKPVSDVVSTFHNLAENFVGKTIATSELFHTPKGEDPAYWFATFTDGTRVIIGVWDGDLLGVSLIRLDNRSLLEEAIKQCPFFFTEEIIETIEQWKIQVQEQRKREARENAIGEFTNRKQRSSWPGELKEARIIVRFEFPDGETREVEAK